MRRMLDLYEMEAKSTEITDEIWTKIRKKAQDAAMLNVPREKLGQYRDTESKKIIRAQVLKVVESEIPDLDHTQKINLIEKLTNEISGYGPLEKILDDEDVTEIIVERFDRIVIEIDGELREIGTKFDDEEHLRLVVERIIAPLGRRLDWASPIVDGRLPDGSRVCAVAPPVAVNGTQLTIRKFKSNISINKLIEFGALSEEIRDALKACIQARMSIVVSGGTGSGKTSFLNALSEYIPRHLSIITIENPVELQLNHPRVRQWEARPANIEGKGEIDMLSLVLTGLRSRPDIIIVGEVRGKEAFALLQALNTGHDGSMTTLHANNTSDAMKRLISMVTSAGYYSPDLVPNFVASGIDIIVHLSRMQDNSRKVAEIAEVIGEKDGNILINPLVTFETEGMVNGKLQGYWKNTGNAFTREEVLKRKGIEFPGWSTCR